MSPAFKTPTPVPPWLLTGLLTVCLVGGYLLLPSQLGLLDRQIRDRSFGKALETLRALPARERRRHPQAYDLMEVSLVRQSLAHPDLATTRKELSACLEAYFRYGLDPAFLEELVQWIAASPTVALPAEVLAGRAGAIPIQARRRVYDALIAKALREGDSTAAAKLGEELWRGHPGQESVAELMVRLWRLAGQPAAALAALEAWRETLRSPLASVSPGIALLRVSLLRETGQAGRAFDGMAELVRAGGAAAREQHLDLLVATARESGRAVEALPEAQAEARAHPGSVAAWRLQAELGLAAAKLEVALEAQEKLVGFAPSGTNQFRLGQLYEWTDHPEKAFTAYLGALSGQVPEAIDRLLALNPGLYLDVELAEALSKEESFVLRAGRGLEFARLLAKAGEFARATRAFDHMANEPGAAPDLLVEYARLELDLSEYPQALALFERADRLRPNDPAITKGRAECLFRLERYKESLDAYDTLIRHSPEDEGLDNLLNLAESLGDLDRLALGLERRLKSASCAPRDYQRLAYFYTQMSRPADTRRTLLAGLERFPEDNVLRGQTAYALADDKQWLEAARVVELHPALQTDADLASLYLSVLVAAHDYRQARSFLRQPLSPDLTNKVAFLDGAALLHEADGELALAEALYARLSTLEPKSIRHPLNRARVLVGMGRHKEAEVLLRPLLRQAGPESLKLAAQIAAAGRDYRAAEAYQRRLLATHPPEAPKEWGFLGDILLARGDKPEARRAYQRALDEMSK